MSWATWRAGAPERRLRRQLRRESYVQCEGDTASHWSGGDYPICSRDGCNGEECRALELQREAYERKGAAAGIEP